VRKARRPAVVRIITIGLLFAATACGTGAGNNGQATRHAIPPATSSSPPAPLQDPPRQFSVAPVATLNNAADAVASGTMVYYFGNTANGGIRSADIEGYSLTTEKNWQAKPAGVSFEGPEIPSGLPGHLLATEVPSPALYYAGTVLQPGQGTQRSQITAQVGSLAASSGASQWNVTLPLPASYYQDDSPDPQQDLKLTLIGADEHHLVVAADGPFGTTPVVWVLDPATGRTMWTRSGIDAVGFGDDTVVVLPAPKSPIDHGTPEGINADTGSVRWPALTTKVTDVGYAMVGPHFIQFTESALLDAATYLIDVRSGKLFATLGSGSATCLFDQVGTVACPSGTSLIALDATTGHRLWSLPDASTNRISPALHAAHKGLLYAQGDSGSGVILDAHSGADAVDDLAVAPDVVVPGYGVVLNDTDDTVTVYRATG
jgi:hypothetical protein